MKFPGWWLSRADEAGAATIEFTEFDESELDADRGWSVTLEADTDAFGVVMNDRGRLALMDFLMGLAPRKDLPIGDWQFIDDGARLAQLLARGETVTEIARAGGRFVARADPGAPPLEASVLLDRIIEASFRSRTDAALRVGAAGCLNAQNVTDAAVAIRACLDYEWGRCDDDIPSYLLEDVKDPAYLATLSAAQRFVLDSWLERVRGGEDYVEKHLPRLFWGTAPADSHAYRASLLADIDAWLWESPRNPAVLAMRRRLSADGEIPS